VLNVMVWLAQNAYVLIKPCSWFDAWVFWAAFLQWTAWSSVSFSPACFSAATAEAQDSKS
jgi:hypothetical protein